MFASLVYCAVSQTHEYVFDKDGIVSESHPPRINTILNQAAEITDVIVIVALVIIGILATQTSLFPNFSSEAGWLILGIGSSLAFVHRSVRELKWCIPKIFHLSRSH